MEREKVQELLKERLREKKLKVTQQRMLVLTTLAENNGKHMAAEEIFEQIVSDFPEMGLATVYRTLQLLLEMQLIDRINLDDGFVRYEIGHLFEGDAKHNHCLLYTSRCV